jgi:hypothetical protein
VIRATRGGKILLFQEKPKMTDQELILNALEEAQRILKEPGSLCQPENTVMRLCDVLDRNELAFAQQRLKARYGVRVIK